MAKVFEIDTGGTLTISLVSYWKTEDVNDYYSTNHLTNTNTVAFNAAKIDNGADYSSTNTNKSLSIASDLGLNTAQAGIFAWAGWVKITSAPGTNEDQTIFGIVPANTLTSNFQYSDTSGTKRFKWSWWNGSTSASYTWDTTLTVDTFYHVIAVKNGTTLTVYLNGSTLGNNTLALADGDPSRTPVSYFGYNKFDSYGPMKGILDEMGVWTKSLSAQEITDLYNSGSGQTMVEAATTSTSSSTSTSTTSTSTSTSTSTTSTSSSTSTTSTSTSSSTSTSTTSTSSSTSTTSSSTSTTSTLTSTTTTLNYRFSIEVDTQGILV